MTKMTGDSWREFGRRLGTHLGFYYWNRAYKDENDCGRCYGPILYRSNSRSTRFVDFRHWKRFFVGARIG